VAGDLAGNKTSAQVAITMDLTATILAATGTSNPRIIRSTESTCCRAGADGRQLSNGGCSGEGKRPTEQRAVRADAGSLLQDGVNFYLFDVARDAA